MGQHFNDYPGFHPKIAFANYYMHTTVTGTKNLQEQKDERTLEKIAPKNQNEARFIFERLKSACSLCDAVINL